METENLKKSHYFDLVVLLLVALALLNIYYSVDTYSKYLHFQKSHKSWLEDDKFFDDFIGKVEAARRPGFQIYKNRQLLNEKRKFLKAELALFDHTDKTLNRIQTDFSLDSQLYSEFKIILNKVKKANKFGKEIFNNLVEGKEKEAFESKTNMDNLYTETIKDFKEFQKVFRIFAHHKAMEDLRETSTYLSKITSLMISTLFVILALYLLYTEKIKSLHKRIQELETLNNSSETNQKINEVS